MRRFEKVERRAEQALERRSGNKRERREEATLSGISQETKKKG